MSTNLGIGLSVTRPTRGFDPARLFADGEQGAWYDPSDFATLYQDSAGTTPVTALGQPVGLMIDKSGNGNHAAQATAAARPTVQARVNLLTNTEGIGGTGWSDNGRTNETGTPPWIDVEVAPDGTQTADALISEAGVTAPAGIRPSFTYAVQQYTISVYAKAGTRGILMFGTPIITGLYVYASFDLQTGTVGTVNAAFSGSSIVDVGNGWYRCSVSFTPASAGSGDVFFYNAATDDSFVTPDDEGYLYLWGAQLELGSTATTYQRVTTATDYADIGLPRYLEFDGVDDAMATQSVDFSASDEMTVVMGMSEYVGGAGIELGTNAASVNGSFLMWGDVAGATGLQKGYYSRGTALSKVEKTSNTTTFVLAGVSKISSDTAILREDGLVLNTSTTDQGTGNYADHPLYIGARGGTTIELNGRIHQLIVRGKTTSGALLDQTERFVARKTGVTL